MQQLQLPLIGRIDAPSVVPAAAIARIATYREAVRAGWMNRRVTGMTRATLAAMTGMRPSHISDYLCAEEMDSRGRERRDMPAKYIPEFDAAVGNTIVSQWIAMQSKLTVLEALQFAA